MLVHLFSSRTRVKLLSIFLLNPSSVYFVRELTRLTGEQINSIRRELENLENIQLLISQTKDNKRFYYLNKEFLILQELCQIFQKMADDRYDIVKACSDFGDIDVLALSGRLEQPQVFSCDILLISNNIKKEKIREFIATLEKKYHREINYAVLSRDDYLFRHTCNDKFLFDFFSLSPLVLIDKIKLSW